MSPRTLYGIDGCPKGWLCVSVVEGSNSTPQARIIEHLSEFTLGAYDIVAVDIPIGLPLDTKDEKNRRACDQAARDTLGERRNSVFFTPSRGILNYCDGLPAQASAWHTENTGRGISIQGFSILRKIKEMDSWIRSLPRSMGIHEVHPELSFGSWGGEGEGAFVILPKKSRVDGRKARLKLVSCRWNGAFEEARISLGPKTSNISGGRRKRLWAEDDLLDAFAALWTAERLSKGEAIRFPQTMPAPLDGMGIPMQIHA